MKQGEFSPLVLYNILQSYKCKSRIWTLSVRPSRFRYTSFAIFLFFGTVYDYHVTLSLRTSVYSRIALTLQTFRYRCTFVSPLWSCHADVTKFRLSRLSRCLYTVFR